MKIDGGPPIVVLTGRRDDAWLTAWSRTEGAVPRRSTPSQAEPNCPRVAPDPVSVAIGPAPDPLPAVPLTGSEHLPHIWLAKRPYFSCTWWFATSLECLDTPCLVIFTARQAGLRSHRPCSARDRTRSLGCRCAHSPAIDQSAEASSRNDLCLPILVLGGIAAAFGLGSVAIAQVTGPKRFDRAKLEAYECGIEPSDQPANAPHAVNDKRFPVKYYLTAICSSSSTSK